MTDSKGIGLSMLVLGLSIGYVADAGWVVVILLVSALAALLCSKAIFQGKDDEKKTMTSMFIAVSMFICGTLAGAAVTPLIDDGEDHSSAAHGTAPIEVPSPYHR